MGEDTKKGFLRVGADFFGGPIDTLRDFLQNTPPTLLPPGPVRALAAVAGLPSQPILPKGDSRQTVGSSDWIADKTGIWGDSPEYQAARAAGNIGLMLSPLMLKAIQGYKPHPGDLNMWIGPKARDYDHIKAAKTAKDYERFLKLKGKRSTLSPNTEDVDEFNKLAFAGRRSIVEPASKKVLQFVPETANKLDEWTFDRLEPGKATLLKTIHKEPALENYPGLGETVVQNPGIPNFIAAFSHDPAQATAQTPHRLGHIYLNKEELLNYGNQFGPNGPEVARAFGSGVLRHETAHSLQRSEGLPPGGNPEMVRELGTDQRVTQAVLDKERHFNRAPAPDLRQALIERAKSQVGDRAMQDPEAVYKNLIGEKLSISSEHHHLPIERVAEIGVPKFSGGVVLDNGELFPVSLYIKGHIPPYNPATQPSPGLQPLTEALQRALAWRK